MITSAISITAEPRRGIGDGSVWPVLHITGLAVGSEWFEVAGALAQAAGFAVMGVAVLRTTDRQWEPLLGGPARPGLSMPDPVTTAR